MMNNTILILQYTVFAGAILSEATALQETKKQFNNKTFNFFIKKLSNKGI